MAREKKGAVLPRWDRQKLLFQKFQHFSRMSAGIGDWNPVLLDCAVGTDKRGRSDRPFGDLALGIFARPPRTIGFHRFFLRIGEQHEREIELGDEVVVGIDAVGTDTDDHGVCF